jgi:hypothetical protein
MIFLYIVFLRKLCNPQSISIMFFDKFRRVRAKLRRPNCIPLDTGNDILDNHPLMRQFLILRPFSPLNSRRKNIPRGINPVRRDAVRPGAPVYWCVVDPYPDVQREQVLKKAAPLAELSSRSVSRVHHSFIATGDDECSHPGNVEVRLMCFPIVCRYWPPACSPVLHWC